MNEHASDLDSARAAGGGAGRGDASTDERMISAWRQWLNALATDAEAAHAAAMAYKDLEPAAREVWIEALSHDIGELGVPKIAVYGPLLAVESDPIRCLKIHAAMGATELQATSSTASHALYGVDRSGMRVAAIITPLYLDFVQVLACGYFPGRRFEWVRHDPILLLRQAPKSGSCLADTVLEPTPLKALIDELARTVLGHRRTEAELPPALEVLSDLFAPILDDGAPESC